MDVDQASRELEMMAWRKILIVVSDNEEEEEEGWIARRMKRKRMEGEKKPRKAKERILILHYFNFSKISRLGVRLGTWGSGFL